LLIWSNGSASATLATTAARSISIRARGDQCAGAPHMAVTIDGVEVLSQDVSSGGWADYGAELSVPDGTHTLTISFTNDTVSGGCDRNLRVDRVAFSATPGFEAEGMSLPASQGMVFGDAAA